MASELEDLYREVILDHSKHPRRAGLREPFTVEVHRVNPTCGDEVTLRLLLTPEAGAGDGDRSGDLGGAVVTDVSYDSLGCSISVAATSVLAESVTGATVAAALDRYEHFHDIVTGGPRAAATRHDAGDATGDGAGATGGDVGDDVEDARAFAGVAKFPGRVKCALLGWSAFREAAVRCGA